MALLLFRRFADPGAGKHDRSEAQTKVDVLGLLCSERIDEDGVAACVSQAGGKGSDHGRGDAPAPCGLQGEQVLDHARTVGGGGMRTTTGMPSLIAR